MDRNAFAAAFIARFLPGGEQASETKGGFLRQFHGRVFSLRMGNRSRVAD
jgi:hypothetical protein